MNISYIPQIELMDDLSRRESASLEFVILVTGALDTSHPQSLHPLLQEAVRVLKKGGILFVQGAPSVLPGVGVFLGKQLTFKYWFAVESKPIESKPLPSVHAGVLLFVKDAGRFNVKPVRLPHRFCAACGRTLKDWGGKAHLMNPEGYVVSDVIKDIPASDNYTQISELLFDILIGLLDFPANAGEQPAGLVDVSLAEANGVAGPTEGLAWKHNRLLEAYAQYTLPDFPLSWEKRNGTQPKPITPKFDVDNLYNVIHQGDSLEILRHYPDESVDLVFADPPYNLDKAYSVYDDGQADQKYVEWCNEWLAEYARILKPTGSLFVLNLPRWAIHHAHFLNQHLHFQNWIVWDALSEPRGKIMPAHYALLFYTKHPSAFTFNYAAVSPIDARCYCLRASCVHQRKAAGDDAKTALNDIWWDLHRIKHRRDRDYHPCQLPDSLMERIIRLATNPGDVVLDAFGGAGTTPITALQLGRRYVAMDVDPNYVEMMRKKIAQVQERGEVQRASVRQEVRIVSKKALQVELRQLSVELGRLPTPEDVRLKSRYGLDVFLETFPTWGKALKAAKVEKLPPVFGSAKQFLVQMADDFDEPLEDFAEYM
ncbi:MAG: site-specific DNA-methyltransferase [Chloroflexi bacterium]|nr:MAG: site-specific DNA-methyltransferase [Chloroflexota bacterium]